MSVTGLAFFALVYFIFVITPGPGVAAMIARGLGTGLKGAWPYALGFMLGDMVWFTVAATGLSALAHQFALAFMAVKYLGCAYLIYLAWKIWRAPPHVTDIHEAHVATAAWPSFMGALTLCLGNPKVIVFFVSVMPLVVDVTHVTFWSYLAMLSVMAPFAPFLTFSILYLAKRARMVFQSAKALKRINQGSAGLMAGAAAVIALKG
ncbi:LysE family translocator [Aestuariivirga litoralis]|uniref:LysE family translocator n=1 Tax=Aestuariivirga litoralis TaxID=2650924 RepID=UPI0018C7A5E7|nr:LysE family translocator [Aestuariivirga litoralis]MBG1233128.1 LysE family translocator [Aestuariivirga litoralis]